MTRLSAWSYSQTGSHLDTYVNGFHPLDVKQFGKPLFDACLLAVASRPTPSNQCAAPIPHGDRRRVIIEPAVPVVCVMSQSDYLSSVGARLPDGDVAPQLMRNYEIAGSGHATPEELTYAAATDDIVRAGRAVPPKAKQIKVVDGEPVLDKFGNVASGVRSPLLDVPTSMWNGNSTGELFCRIAGHEKPFDTARIAELYPKPGDYAKAVEANVTALVAAQFITAVDGQSLMAEARRAK